MQHIRKVFWAGILYTWLMPKQNKQNPLQAVLDVALEDNADITKKFQQYSEENDVFLSMIATYSGVKVSPSRERTASMGIYEEFGIESAIEEIKQKCPEPKTLYLMINSPGGLVSSSYKVARALRKNFSNIIVFVPHIAASGGTLVALTGNEIVMGMMSQITPLDPSSSSGSALSVVRGFRFANSFFINTSEEDAPYTFKVLADGYTAEKFDAAISSLELMKNYVIEILTDAMKADPDEDRDEFVKRIEKLASDLVEGFLTHTEVINLDKAKDIGLNVVPNSKYTGLWESFRRLLGNYLLQSADKHIIRYWINTGKDNKKGEVKDERRQQSEQKVSNRGDT
jgi:hypothetical protein